MTNYENFPFNILKPYIKTYAFLETNGTCSEKEYIIYPIRFKGLEDVYYYLTNNPHVNKKVFNIPKLHSQINSDEIAKTYEESLNSLLDYKNIILPEDYIQLSDNLNQTQFAMRKTNKRKRTYGGGMLDTRRICSGDPKCFFFKDKTEEHKLIQLNINIAYGSQFNSNQAEHFAYFLVLFVNGLQRKNYEVIVNTIYLTMLFQEIIDININLKQIGKNLNIQQLYKIVSNVDFNRIVLFRVIETVDVKEENWLCNYGNVCDKDQIFKIKGLTNNDIYISPKELGITGEDLNDDIICAYKSLNIEKYLKVEDILAEQKILRRYK